MDKISTWNGSFCLESRVEIVGGFRVRVKENPLKIEKGTQNLRPQDPKSQLLEH